MARVSRYPGQDSEYGGGDGSPQRFPNGASLPLNEGVGKSVGQRARLLRMAMAEDFDPAQVDAVGLANPDADKKGSAAEAIALPTDQARTAHRAAQRERLMDKTNGYIAEPEQYEGEQVQ